ncbi:mrr restriction system protein [alpha proteobacterium BAL199]|nr:mrr restriction system protein [alpha proteobacterium BAL199]
MAIPDYQTLMLPVLRLAAAGETRVPDAAETIADDLGLSAAEREELLPSGRQRLLHNRIHWAKFYMNKAGLIDQPRRGRFVVSETGKQLLSTSPERIDVARLMQYQEFREFYTNAGTAKEVDGPPDQHQVAPSPSAGQTPEEQIEAAHRALQTALRGELLQRILQNSPSFFEQVIVDLLVAMGYGGSHRNAAEQLGRTGDGGVDGVINEDRLGLDRVYIQAKRYGPNVSVGRPEVQAFVGSLVGLGASKSVFVTTSTFSQHATDFARHLSQRIILIDGVRLGDLMIEYNVGVRVARTVEFKRLDEDFFAEDQ